MKKLTILAALCALLLGSCTENNLDGVTPETAITLPDLTAGFAEDDTKTYVENGKYLRWHEADLITAFYGNALNRQYRFKGQTGANSGTFALVPSGELGTGNELGAIYAVYPYDEGATITDEGTMTINLPAVQNHAENSFGKGANTMIAVTENIEDTFLGFKNACGYLKLKLYGEDVTLASVEVRGNNGEKIAGSATATMEFGGVPTLAMNNDATTTVTLDCGEGVVLGATAETATELWIVLPETTFEGGITITATDTEGITFEKSTNNTIAIVRNEIQPMSALKVECAPANNEIWYTNGSTTTKTTPYQEVFGANIVSNTYDSKLGCWVIKFDRDVTIIGEFAFYSCTALTSVTIPESVTKIGNGAFRYCSNLTQFKGSFASEDGRCLIVNNTMVEFAPAGLTEYTIPEGVTSIGMSVFANCSNLTNVTIPNSVITIDTAAFGSSGITSIVIPDSVETIGRTAFSYCEELASITIGSGVKTIVDYAFDGCTSLNTIYCKAVTPPTAYSGIFSAGSYSYRKIYVPTDSVYNYKSAEHWSNYASNIVGYDF